MSGIANTEWEYRKIDLGDLPREKNRPRPPRQSRPRRLGAHRHHDQQHGLFEAANQHATLKTKSIKGASVSFTALL